MSDTSPSEHARIAELAGNDPRWTEALIALAIIKDRSKRADEWMEKHDLKDERRFSDVYKRIDEKIGAVISSVAPLKSARDRLQGGWSAVVIIAGILAFVIDALIHLAEHFK